MARHIKILRLKIQITVSNHGRRLDQILNDIDNNPQTAAIIGVGGRLQSDIVRRCSVRYRPY